jgi:hypothetical protein
MPMFNVLLGTLMPMFNVLLGTLMPMFNLNGQLNDSRQLKSDQSKGCGPSSVAIQNQCRHTHIKIHRTWQTIRPAESQKPREISRVALLAMQRAYCHVMLQDFSAQLPRVESSNEGLCPLYIVGHDFARSDRIPLEDALVRCHIWALAASIAGNGFMCH